YNSAKQAGKDAQAAVDLLNDTLKTFTDKLAADQRGWDESVRLRTESCHEQYNGNSTADALCVYLITHPVDSYAMGLYNELKYGSVCKKLHPVHVGLVDQAYLDCVNNGPGDGVVAKAVEWATPVIDLVGGTIQALADKLHVDPMFVAFGLGIAMAG